MHARRNIGLLCLLLVGTLLHGFASADKDEATNTEAVKETVEVERAQTKGPKHPSLRFLKDNRVFLRARLDELSIHIKRTRTGEAEIIDERYLMLQEMAAAIAAARDTVGSTREHTAEREMLASVSQLGELEAELDLMDKLLSEQRGRLLRLEEDFLGHQETALVILLKGLSGKRSPASIVISEDDDIVRVPLSPDQRTSLEQGGIAQIYHEFVEPREHVFSVGFTGEAWIEEEPVAVVVETARDRLTFLELDLSHLDRDREASGLLTSVWYR